MSETPDGHEAIDIEYLKHEFEKFRAGLAEVKGKLGGNAHAALDHISAYLNGGALSSRISSLEAELSSLSGKIKDGGKGAVTKLEHEVSNRPIASIAAAFGVGLLAAHFLRRK
jgi:ElaB/YqjD/DUF883 family membrane-anchored ribosome-binding protein